MPGFWHVAAKIADLVLSPAALVGFLVAVSAVQGLRGRRASATAAAVAGAGLFLCAGVLPLPEVGLRVLEDRFARPRPMPAAVDGIVLLGGTIDAAVSESRGTPSLGGSAARVLGFVELAQRYPSARLVFSGGTGTLFRDGPREADQIRPVLETLGLEMDRITFERESASTWENARETAALVAPGAGETWLLVTSARHMPRAVGAFRKAGWNVTAYPVDYRTEEAGEGRYSADMTSRLRLADQLVHELVGLVYYRLAGYSTALFPGP